MAKTILVVAAHPDDEVLGAGGAIARHREEGDRVAVLILGEGIASRTGLTSEGIEKAQGALERHAKNALKILGAPHPMRARFRDNAFDSVPLLDIVQEIESAIAKVRPTLIYTHHGSDVNIDHGIVSRAVEAATRPLEKSTVAEVRAFEVPSSTEWNFTRPAFRANLFVPLTESQLKKKIRAMKAYVGEIRTFPHPRSPRYLESLARVRGGQSGCKAAEAFELVYRKV